MSNFIKQIILDDKTLNNLDHFEMLQNVVGELNTLDSETLGLSNEVNTVANKYLVDFAKPKIEEYSSISASAYPARVHNDNKQYYCLLFRNDLPNRLAEMITLKASPVEGLANPIGIGISQVQEQSKKALCAVCELPKGKTLKEWVKTKQKFSQQFICDKILPQISKIIFELHKLGITHGRINPSNIFLDEEYNVTLGDCISDLSGVMQPACYETIHRAQIHQYAKGRGDISIDYYALGMTVFSLTSSIFFEDKNNIDTTEIRLQEGSFQFLNLYWEMTGVLSDIIRGLVIDDPTIRWGYEEIQAVIGGKNYSLANLVDKNLLPRSIIFNDISYTSKESLAYALSKNWQAAQSFIKQASITKWLNTSINEQTTAEALEKLQSLIIKRRSTYAVFSKDDEHLMKLILLLDPKGPLRYKNICLNKEGVGSLLAYSIANNNNELMQFVANILFVDFFSFYDQLAIWFEKNEYFKGLLALKHATSMIRRGGNGFGIERCNYDLNPSLSLISDVINGELLYGVKDILLYIENNQISVDNLLSKKSILCFIASKIGVAENLIVVNYKNYYGLEKEKALISLEILSLAQEKAEVGKLVNLSTAFAEKIKEVLQGVLRSDSIKKNIFSSIDKVKNSGDLKLLKQTATNIKYFEQDTKGFIAAIKRVDLIEHELKELEKKDKLNHIAKHKGFRYAIIIGYIVAIISVIISFIKLG